MTYAQTMRLIWIDAMLSARGARAAVAAGDVHVRHWAMMELT